MQPVSSYVKTNTTSMQGARYCWPKTCKSHGGRSTGPRTEAGKARCGAAHWVHGNSTRQARAELSEELVKLALLEELGRKAGLITGPRSRGRRPGYRKALGQNLPNAVIALTGGVYGDSPSAEFMALLDFS